MHSIEGTLKQNREAQAAHDEKLEKLRVAIEDVLDDYGLKHDTEMSADLLKAIRPLIR